MSKNELPSLDVHGLSLFRNVKSKEFKCLLKRRKRWSLYGTKYSRMDQVEFMEDIL